MPEQPISSRFRLTQAVVRANRRSKAVSLGLEIEQPFEEEVWREGQPTVSVIRRTIKVLKRWDYNPRDGQPAQEFLPGEATIDVILGDFPPGHAEPTPPVWGIDIQATRRVHGYQTKERQGTSLPMYAPESA
ncbi:hypothetical protein BJY00DRAFT_277137 [Aspergillus carlsbadensis]|nr:hypothetical protein BJY00DRAFT_277137 [Aspergillus carlsbadensis]